MGFQDRHYAQDEDSYSYSSYQSRTEPFISTKIVIATVVIYLIAWVIDQDGTDHSYRWLALSTDFWDKPWEIWRFLTYGFHHSPFWIAGGTLYHIAGNMFGLYMFGRFVEQRIGKREFLCFYLITIVLCGLGWLLVRTASSSDEMASVVGASGGVVGVVILFCFMYPNEKVLLFFVVPMKSWVFGLLLVGLDLFGTMGHSVIGSTSRIAFEAHLMGAAFAALYFKLGWRTEWIATMFTDRRRRRIKIHKPKEDKLAVQADAILGKIQAQGRESLTPREEKLLIKYSNQMRKQDDHDEI